MINYLCEQDVAASQPLHLDISTLNTASRCDGTRNRGKYHKLKDCCMNRLKTLKGKLNVSTAVQYQSIADVNEWKSFTAETCIQQFTNSGDSSGIMQSAPNAHDCFAYSIVERRTTCEDALEPQLAQEVGNAPEGHQEK
ncbi:hypothetical protein TgHK011_004246 [Trichoderma gracile]|nr:hypothetical protein TgHK011_004246 [Trichoderma gracile]